MGLRFSEPMFYPPFSLLCRFKDGSIRSKTRDYGARAACLMSSLSAVDAALLFRAFALFREPTGDLWN